MVMHDVAKLYIHIQSVSLISIIYDDDDDDDK